MKMMPYSPILTAKGLRALVLKAFLLALFMPGYGQIVTTYTSNGTFVVPAGVTQVTVECWGAGGRGATRNSNGAGGGGGGGAYVMSVLNGVSGTYTVTVGAGSSSTAAGGDSWFGTAGTVMAKGGQSAADNSPTGATGGLATASVGGVKRNGGDGGPATNGDGGGGGSSAGPNAPGVTATSATGAIAPTGGGNGGAGQTGTNAAGGAGSDPGGGGGGATRTSGTKAGGTGGDGQVVVTYFVEGVCMSAVSSNAIPDNSGYMSIGVPVSGLPTALGTNGGNARLVSVEFIISHTTNDQLDITLTSPANDTRTLSMDRFGSGDNYGNPVSCPGSAFVMQDGGAALTNTNTNNPTGPYAPTQSLVGFTGNPNGVWFFNVRDDATGTIGNLRYIKLNFCVTPEITATSTNSPICAGGDLTLGVTASNATAYSWSGTGAFTPNTSSASVTVAGAATGTYTITASNTCGSTSADVAAVVNPLPQGVSAASSSNSVCSNANTVNLTSTGYSVPPLVLSQNFNGGIAPWTTTNTSTGGTVANAAWTARPNNYQFNAYDGLVTFSSNDASQFVLSNSDSQGSGTTATTIVSPSFSTVGYTALSLSYYHYYRFNSGTSDRARVEVSTTGGSSWTIVETHSSVQGAPSGFVNSTINLNSYVNEPNVQIRFRYDATWDYFWALDNVVVTGTPNPVTFAWTSAPSGFTSALQNPTSVAVTQSTVYTVTVSTASGCAATANASVTHNTAPSATIAYTGTPYCQSAGTASVNRVGTAGGSYSAAPAGLNINTGTGLVTLGTSTPGAYSVTYTVAAAGACALFSTTAGITVTAPPSATISYSGTPYCQNAGTASVSQTGTAGGVYSAAPAGLSINAGTGLVTLGTSTPGSYTVTYTVAAANGCPLFSTTAGITVTATPAATISYTGTPYCLAAGTAAVTQTGTAGGSYSASPSGLSIDPSTGLLTLGASIPNAYTVTYTIAAAGGCALYTTTAPITVTPASVLYEDTDGDGFGDPSSPLPSCTPVAGYVANNTDDCPVLFGRMDDPCDDGDANTINDQIDGSCICAGTIAPWYSQGSGTFADPIWSHNPTGPGAAATINAGSSVVIQAGHTVTLAAARSVNDLTVASGGILSLASYTMSVYGSAVQIDGTLQGNTGTVVLAPTSTATLSGSGLITFNNLTVNASNGLTCSADIGVKGTLLLTNGVFTASGVVNLISNASGTGRLGPVAPTASYSGNLTVNRYIPAGATNWRMVGSSVSGQTVNDLKDDFYTAGFPGSHYPNFFSPLGSSIFWPSIRWYDETNAGNAVIDGLTGATSTSQAMTPGQGFAAWSGTTFATTTAFTIDMTGTPNVANTPIALPMSYTDTGVPATDGWNMVSNPLPSPIAFSQLVRGADVEDYITYFDPATGNNATWDLSLGAGTNTGTNTIQSSQGFWLKATGSDVTTTVSEGAKVSGNTGGFFGGDQEQLANIVRLRITSSMNQYSDETLLVFSQGSPETNGDDVPKFVFAHPEAPQIATQGDAGQMIAINAYGPYNVDISIPVIVDVAVNGDYTITANGLDLIGLSCVRLEDLATNISTPLVEGSSYTFTALANDDPAIIRFVLHASAPLQFSTTPASCAGRDDGAATVVVGSGPVDILWMDGEGTTILEQEGVQAGPSGIFALEAGDYSISISSMAGCGNLLQAFAINEPTGLEVEADAMPTSCPDSDDGTLELYVLGGNAPYTYLWSNGAEESAIEVPAGTYTVEVSDANGCSITSQEYLISAGEGPDANISVENVVVMVDDEVAFFASTVIGVTNTWDFGDGTTSTELEPVHSYATPGNYTVVLTVDDGTCTSTTELELTVETTTGLATIVGHTLNAWVSGDVIVVDHNFDDNEPVIVRILSTNGQLAQEHRFAGQPARLTMPTAELATGIWLVRVSSGPSVRTFSLPVLH